MSVITVMATRKQPTYAYLSLFLHDAHHDDDMTVPEYTSDSPSCRNPHKYREKYRS
jgi:hypothetical protein